MTAGPRAQGDYLIVGSQSSKTSVDCGASAALAGSTDVKFSANRLVPAVVTAASWLPAHRAAGVDPLTLLRRH